MAFGILVVKGGFFQFALFFISGYTTSTLYHLWFNKLAICLPEFHFLSFISIYFAAFILVLFTRLSWFPIITFFEYVMNSCRTQFDELR